MKDTSHAGLFILFLHPVSNCPIALAGQISLSINLFCDVTNEKIKLNGSIFKNFFLKLINFFNQTYQYILERRQRRAGGRGRASWILYVIQI